MKGRTLSSLLIAGAALVGAPDVSAHGGIPRAYSVLFEPGNPDHIILRSDVWGLFRSTDGGQTWSWLCAEAWAATSTDTKRLSMALLPGGTVMVASQFKGLQISQSGKLCDFAPAAELDGELVKDVTLAKDDGSLVYALTSTGSQEGVTVQLWESTDQGATWSTVGAPLPDDGANDFTGESVAVAPSDGSRLYVGGKFSGAATVQRSDDAGLTWQAFSVPAVIDSPVWGPRITAVDPTNPDLVYFWADAQDEDDPDQLWMSLDAGATWELIVDGAGNLPGFALSPDGATVAVAGPVDGLLSAATADLATQGAGAFSQIDDGIYFGLEWTDAGLYAGTNDFVAEGDRFTFSVSTDDGASFDGIMTVCDPTLIECGADTFAGAKCGEHYADLQTDMAPRCVGSSGGSGGAGGSTGGMADAGPLGGAGGGAAGAGAGAGGGDEGCSCSVPGRAASSGMPAVIALAAAAASVGIGRRKRRPS